MTNKLKLIPVIMFSMFCMACPSTNTSQPPYAYNNDQETKSRLDHYEEIEIDGMKFGIWTRSNNYNYADRQIINLTKDKLEVELLRKQLENK